MAKESKKTAEKDYSAEILEIAHELFGLLGVNADVKVEDKDEAYQVLIESSDSGLLIGAHGTTLNAIQSFLAMAMKSKTGEWVRINVDVGGWKARHDEYLEELAQQAAERVRSTNEAQHLYNLSPAQRRVIHTYLGKEKDLITESVGEGEARYLVVKPK